MKKHTLLITVLSSVIPLIICAMECSNCRRKIHGQYFRASGQDYCSRECFLETLPKCEVCEEPCQQMYTIQERHFCSKECLYQVFKCVVCQNGLEEIFTVRNNFGREHMYCHRCRSLPGCFFCAMPDNYPALPDGRRICRECRESAVMDQREIRRIFNHLRRELSRLYGYDKDHDIELHIVDLNELLRLTPPELRSSSGSQMGLMRYHKQERVRTASDGRQERETVDERCRIYVLSNMPRAMLIDTLVHELTHDHIRHNVGSVQDKVSEEGFCELVASLFNARIGNSFLNRRKETSTDPVYGAGFRRMRAIYRRNRSLPQTMRSVR